MSIFDSLFGNNTSTTTSQTTLGNNAQGLASDLFSKVQAYANTPYVGFDASTPRTASWDPAQLAAFRNADSISANNSSIFNTLQSTVLGDAATRPTGAVSNLANQIGSSVSNLAQTLPNFDISAYMNPYVQQVLDPAIGDIERNAALERNRLAGTAAKTGSFGGSRNMLADQELQRNTANEIGRLSANERARAYTEGVNQIRQDQQAIPALLMAGQQGYKNLSDYQAAGYNNLSNLLSANTSRITPEVSNQLATGGLKQAYQQDILNKLQQDFIDQRESPLRGINALLGVLNSGSAVTGTSTSQQTAGPQPNAIGQVLGATTGILGSLGGVSGIANTASNLWNTGSGIYNSLFGSGSTSGFSPYDGGASGSGLAGVTDYFSW